MLIVYILFIYFFYVHGFLKQPFKNKPTFLYSNQPSTTWNTLSNNFKSLARQWFINRAEKKGIAWTNMTNFYKNEPKIKRLFDNMNSDIVYPDYYTQPFHGYDDGNLNWKAAYEGEAATLSMAVNYWKDIDPVTTEKWLRHNISSNIKNYISNISSPNTVNSILDVGCSIGISTEYLYKSFLNSKNITGLDLSPYFLSVAKYRSENLNLPIHYVHRNAENTELKKGSYDLIVCNFILHEVPPDPSKKILKEMYNLLAPGGILAVVDLNPNRIQDNLIVSTFRKWAFEVTEPHIYEYYNSNMSEWMKNTGFKNIKTTNNDPINCIWFGEKKGNLKKKPSMFDEFVEYKKYFQRLSDDEQDTNNYKKVPSLALTG